MPDDARLLELTWLTRLEQNVGLPELPHGDCPERRLLVHLLAEGHVNGPAHVRPGMYGTAGAQQHRDLVEEEKWRAIIDVMEGRNVPPRISHAGAVRRAELEQQLKSGRIKESMGLVWDGRHFRQDARIALLDASAERPVAVAYLDLNDVRAFNAVNHDTGDAAILRYLEIVAGLTYDRGDAYRLSGGADEVVILLPRLQLEHALDFVRKLLTALGRERVADLSLRAAAGVVIATDPGGSVDALKKLADAQQGRAKDASKATEKRPSVLAWAPDRLEVVPAASAP